MHFWLPSSSFGGYVRTELFLKANTKGYSDCSYRLWWCRIQFLLKTDAKLSYGYPPPLVVVSFSVLIEN